MFRLRRAPTILFSASQFRVGQSNATQFSIDEPGRDQEPLSPSSSGSKAVLEHDLSITIKRKKNMKSVRHMVSVSALSLVQFVLVSR